MNTTIAMRYAVLSICVIGSVLATSAQGRNDAVEHEIASLEVELNRARFENDVAAVRRLFAVELYSVGATGAINEIGNKGEGLFNQTPNGAVWRKVDHGEPRVRVYGDTAISTYSRRLESVTRAGASTTEEFMSSHVWVKRDGRWQLVFAQTTRIPPANGK
jgi:ketosteroid isomerase-like protein